jgi:lipopolysaccharide transport system permease protein
MSLSVETKPDHRPYLRVDARTKSIIPNFRELWMFREMLMFLVTRDVKVRYRQTLLGAAWAVIQPITSMIVFTIVFGGFAKVSSNGVPYPLFAFAAVVPWTFFTNVVNAGADSLVSQANLVRKVYFPRIFVPLSRILSVLTDFTVAFILLLLILAYYTFLNPSYRPINDEVFMGRGFITNTFSTSPLAIIVIPVLVLYMMTITLGMILWLSGMNVRYRDVKYLVPFGVSILTYLTPVAYPSGLVPAKVRWLYDLNPMVTVIDGFRWVLLGQHPVSFASILPGLVVTLVLLITGMLFFTYVEGTFADII